MVKKLICILFCVIPCLGAMARDVEVIVIEETDSSTWIVVEDIEIGNGIIALETDSLQTAGQDKTDNTWSPKPKHGPGGVHFAWGAEVGSSIDMSGHDMSSIDFNASFGLSCGWFSFIGVGAGANIMVNNSNRTYPMFATIRTDFSKFVKFLFIDLRGGVALNYFDDDSHQTGAYVAPSLGFNLATGKTFRSYITLGYTYLGRHDITVEEETRALPSLSMATLRLGICF